MKVKHQHFKVPSGFQCVDTVENHQPENDPDTFWLCDRVTAKSCFPLFLFDLMHLMLHIGFWQVPASMLIRPCIRSIYSINTYLLIDEYPLVLTLPTPLNNPKITLNSGFNISHNKYKAVFLRTQIYIQIIWLIILFQIFLATVAKEFYTLSICHLDRTKCPIKHVILRICRHHNERRDSILVLSHVLWIVACQAPLSMGFSRQGYWSGLPFPPPEELPDPGMKLVSPAL